MKPIYLLIVRSLALPLLCHLCDLIISYQVYDRGYFVEHLWLLMLVVVNIVLIDCPAQCPCHRVGRVFNLVLIFIYLIFYVLLWLLH